MVIDDNSQGAPTPAREPLPLEDRLASPMDRLAAAVADFVIVSPLATLVMSPFRRMAEEAQLQGSDDRWFIATASAFGAAFLLVIAYQVVFLLKWRATPGKRLMGLTVESLWQDEGAKMRPQAALIRALAWCAEVALCGFPWIAVIGNERRRPFHDRLADTVVLSKRRGFGPPGVHEMSLASGLVGAFFMSLLIVVTIRLGHFAAGHSGDGETELTGGACEQVDHAEKSWLEAIGETKPSRMSIALSLYESESIDEECLKSEADAALWKPGAKDLAYLARGLAEKSDDELSQKYLDRACDGSSETDACKALAFLNDGEMPDDPVEAKAAQVAHDTEILNLIGTLTVKSEPFLKVLAIRELTTRHQSVQALALIDSMTVSTKDLSFFLSSERMKTLWVLNRKSEARVSMKAAIGGYDGEQRVSMLRWFCQTETSETGCSALSKPACDLLSASVDHDPILLGDPEVTLTYVRAETCAQRLNKDKFAELKQHMPDQASQSYIEALAALQESPTDGARKLRAVCVSDSAFSNEARAKLIELATAEKELTYIREEWVDSDSTADGWAYVGRRLMTRYNDFRAWDKTIEIGFKMGEGEPLDQQTAKTFIVAAYRSGQTKMALDYLRSYFDNAQQDTLRAPASADGFEEIAREIRGDFSNRMPSHLPSKKKTTR